MATINGLVKRVREEFLDDATGASEADYLWKTAHIISSLSQSEKELAERLFLISDSTTPEICRIAITAVAGVFPQTLPLDERVIRVERLLFPGVTRPLVRKTVEWLDQNDSGWYEKAGVPDYFVADVDTGSFTLSRRPVAAGIISLTVKRRPLYPLNEVLRTDSPELRNVDDELIHGALKYLYLKPDLEGYDAGLSAKWEMQFERDIKRLEQNRAALNPQAYVCRPERF